MSKTPGRQGGAHTRPPDTTNPLAPPHSWGKWSKSNPTSESTSTTSRTSTPTHPGPPSPRLDQQIDKPPKSGCQGGARSTSPAPAQTSLADPHPEGESPTPTNSAAPLTTLSSSRANGDGNLTRISQKHHRTRHTVRTEDVSDGREGPSTGADWDNTGTVTDARRSERQSRELFPAMNSSRSDVLGGALLTLLALSVCALCFGIHASIEKNRGPLQKIVTWKRIELPSSHAVARWTGLLPVAPRGRCIDSDSSDYIERDYVERGTSPTLTPSPIPPISHISSRVHCHNRSLIPASSLVSHKPQTHQVIHDRSCNLAVSYICCCLPRLSLLPRIVRCPSLQRKDKTPSFQTTKTRQDTFWTPTSEPLSHESATTHSAPTRPPFSRPSNQPLPIWSPANRPPSRHATRSPSLWNPTQSSGPPYTTFRYPRHPVYPPPSPRTPNRHPVYLAHSPRILPT